MRLLFLETFMNMAVALSNSVGFSVVWTPGAGAGFSTSLTRFPDDRVTVIVFCNVYDFLLADELARGIGECVIPGLKAARLP